MAGGAARMSLESHRAVEAGVGLALLLVPFGLRFGLEDGVDFSGEALVVCAVIGLVAATLGFAGTRLGSDPSGLSHSSFDRGITVGMLIAAIVFAARGEMEATVLLAGAILVYGWLMLSTRYTGAG
jgi:hypothetical protein